MEREMTNWIDNIWPKFLDAGLSIVWAVILLIIGIKVINVARKLLKSALEVLIPESCSFWTHL